MAITFVGSKTFTHAATTAQTCSLTDLLDSSGATATLAENDVVFVNYALGSVDVNRSNVQMTPSGYTDALPTVDLYGNDTRDINQLVSYKIMPSTPDSSVSIPASSSTSYTVSVTITVLRGVDTSTPIDAVNYATGLDSFLPNPPSITPNTAGSWILAFGAGCNGATAFFSNPSGMSTITNHFRTTSHTSGTRAVVGVAIYTSWTSGAYDPAAFGLGSGSNSAAYCWTAVTLAVKPASVGGGGRRRIVIS